MRQYLKELRQSRNLRQHVVAQKLGVSQSYYNLIENYKRRQNMDIKTLAILCDVMAVPYDYIIEQELLLMQQK